MLNLCKFKKYNYGSQNYFKEMLEDLRDSTSVNTFAFQVTDLGLIPEPYIVPKIYE